MRTANEPLASLPLSAGKPLELLIPFPRGHTGTNLVRAFASWTDLQHELGAEGTPATLPVKSLLHRPNRNVLYWTAP